MPCQDSSQTFISFPSGNSGMVGGVRERRSTQEWSVQGGAGEQVGLLSATAAPGDPGGAAGQASQCIQSQNAHSDCAEGQWFPTLHLQPWPLPDFSAVARCHALVAHHHLCPRLIPPLASVRRLPSCPP
jgi:hypothetical protein